VVILRNPRFVLENKLYLTEHNYCAREIGIKQPLFGVLSRNIRIHLFQQTWGKKLELRLPSEAQTVPFVRSVDVFLGDLQDVIRMGVLNNLAGAPSVHPYPVNPWRKGKVRIRFNLCSNAIFKKMLIEDSSRINFIKMVFL